MKVNIFFRPEEAMLENWQNLVFYSNIFLFFEKIEPVSALKKGIIYFAVSSSDSCHFGDKHEATQQTKRNAHYSTYQQANLK